MDELILTFNKEQMSLYKELLTKENIKLDFDTSMPEIDRFYLISFDDILSDIENEAKILLNFNKRSTSFTTSLTQEKIKEFTPVYYNAILEINRKLSIINGLVFKLSLKMGEIDLALIDVNRRYADFLPCKAALCNRDSYSSKINELDTQFKENIKALDALKAELLTFFEKSEKISNIVSDFIKKSSKATDEPKFKNFNYNDFFWTVEAFLERIKTVKNN